MAQLQEQKTAEVFELRKDVVVLGRGADNDWVIYDSRVSLRHCRVLKMSDGFYVEDLGSKNGVRINGELVRTQRLLDGDELMLGESIYRFDAQSEDLVEPDPRVHLRFVSSQRANEVLLIDDDGLRLGIDGKQTVLLFRYLESHYIRCEFNHPNIAGPMLNNLAISDQPMRLQNGDQLSLIDVQLQYCDPHLARENPSTQITIPPIANDRNDDRVREVSL